MITHIAGMTSKKSIHGIQSKEMPEILINQPLTIHSRYTRTHNHRGHNLWNFKLAESLSMPGPFLLRCHRERPTVNSRQRAKVLKRTLAWSERRQWTRKSEQKSWANAQCNQATFRSKGREHTSKLWQTGGTRAFAITQSIDHYEIKGTTQRTACKHVIVRCACALDGNQSFSRPHGARRCTAQKLQSASFAFGKLLLKNDATSSTFVFRARNNVISSSETHWFNRSISRCWSMIVTMREATVGSLAAGSGRSMFGWTGLRTPDFQRRFRGEGVTSASPTTTDSNKAVSAADRRGDDCIAIRGSESHICNCDGNAWTIITFSCAQPN